MAAEEDDCVLLAKGRPMKRVDERLLGNGALYGMREPAGSARGDLRWLGTQNSPAGVVSRLF